MRIFIIILLFIDFSASILHGQDSSKVEQIKKYKSISQGLNSPEEVIILDLHQPKRISKEISLFTNLQELDIYMPRFRKLPKRIGDLEKLNTLIITGSQESKIKKLPSELGELRELRWLRLWNIELNKVPQEIEGILKSNINKTDSLACSQNMLDFFNLKNKELQAEFFSKLDSIKKEQYPEFNQEITILNDITPKYLNAFLKDIDKDSFLKNKQFVKEYHFNIAPDGFTDPKVCSDKIEVVYDEQACSFRLVVYHTFLVDVGWCVESTISYGFSIQENTIVYIWRQEAG